MKNNLIKGNSDFLLGIIIIVFSGVVYWLACGIALAESAMLPKLLAVIMALMGLGISIKSIKDRAANGGDDVHVYWSDIFNGILIPGAFLMGAYGLINILGFYVAEFLLVLALMLLQDKVTNGKINWSRKRVITVLIYAILSIVVMYVIFHHIFSLPTPKGIFGF